MMGLYENAAKSEGFYFPSGFRVLNSDFLDILAIGLQRNYHSCFRPVYTEGLIPTLLLL